MQYTLPGSFRSKACLVVGNDEGIRAYVNAILKREHIETIEVSNGIGALRLLTRFGEDIDLIVVDVNIPEGDGETFIRAARELFPALPVVLISADPNKTLRERSQTPTMEFVEKPFAPVTLLMSIRAAKLNAPKS